jgi:methylmalonyl-CoA mutase N-terminal domain/subunit
MTAEARYQEASENGQKIIVGVNDYVDPNEPDIETLHIDPRIETRQKIRLQSIRSRRNSREVIRTLDHLKKTIQAGRNIMPPLLETVKAYATLEGRSWLYYRKGTVYMMNQRFFS